MIDFKKNIRGAYELYANKKVSAQKGYVTII